MATLAFFVTLALQFAAVAVALKSGSPQRRRSARALLVASIAPVCFALGSSLVSVSALVVALATWLADPLGREGALVRMPRPGIAQAAAFALLVFVSIGTLARQVVTYGATSSERPDYGAQGQVLEAFLRLSWPSLGLLILLAMLFVARTRLGQEGA